MEFIQDSHVIQSMMDNINRGLICVDDTMRIVFSNAKSRTITGIAVDSPAEHPAGQLEPGDIVIIADNMFNSDDGHIGQEGLQCLNVHDSSIEDNDIFLCAAIYRNEEAEPVYKHLKEHPINRAATLQTTYFGFDITASVNDETGDALITVNGAAYPMHYYHNICNTVVIDGRNGSIKFVQALGYSARREGAGELLRGAVFQAKCREAFDVDIKGHYISDLFDCPPLLDDIQGILERKAGRINDRLYRINQIPFISDIIPWSTGEDDSIQGAFLLLTNIEDLLSSIEHGNNILREMEDLEHQSHLISPDLPANALAGITGHSARITEVKYLACKAAKNEFTVCITGESGTGKSVLAREIHRMGNPAAPFVEVNCNAISQSLFESELFGYVKGAFTGARSEGKVGFFEAANGGTIFLDEIGDLPPDIQIKLLQVLQNKTIYKVGSTKPLKIHVRVIVATNQDLKKRIEEKKFRSDLYYRINVFPIEVPPLRERKSDLYLLVNSIMTRTCEMYGLETKQLSEEAIHLLISYDWPGNVRELENVIERAVTLCESNMIYPEHLRLENPEIPLTMRAQLDVEEKRILEKTLLKYNGDKEKSMKELDLSRSVFYQRLKKHGLTA